LVRRDAMAQITEIVGGLGFGLAAGPIPFDVGGPWQREIHRLSRIGEGDVLTLDFLVEPAPLIFIESRYVSRRLDRPHWPH